MVVAIERLSLIARKITDLAEGVSLRLNQGKTKVIFFGTSTFVDRLNSLNNNLGIKSPATSPLDMKG